MKKYLQKRNRIKNKNLKYDFLPPMLEVIERPSNKVGSIIILGICFLLATVIVWAAFFKLDVVVTAPGTVAPEGELVKIQAASGGIVESILVKDGDPVRQGDILAELKKDTDNLGIEDLKYQIELLKVQKEVYEKIYLDEWKDIEAGDYGEFSHVVNGMLREQELYLSQEKEYRLQIEHSEEKELARTTLKSYQIRREMEVLQNISNLDVQLRQGITRLKQAEEGLEGKSIQAPASGIISQVQIDHAGEALSASQTIGYIVPEGTDMVFRCYVRNADISYLDEGQEAEVKLDAYSYSEYGTVKGKILYVDKIAVSIEGMGAVYPVLISLEKREDIDYRTGLSGSCDIHVSDRTVLEYFLEPIRKGFGESLNET